MNHECTVAECLKQVWANDPDLNSVVPATEDETNRFFEEGLDLVGAALPYAILEQSQVVSSSSLGAGAFLDNLVFQLRIYSRTRAEASWLSQAAVRAYFLASCHETGQGQACEIKVDSGVQNLLPEGVRRVTHQLIVTVTNKIY